jgi:hypothetical protein
MEKLNEKAAAISGALLCGLMSLFSGVFFLGGSMMGGYGGRYYGGMMGGYYNQPFGGIGLIFGIIAGLIIGAIVGYLAAAFYNWGLGYSAEKSNRKQGREN